MSTLDPHNLGDYGSLISGFVAFLAAIWAIIQFLLVRPFKIFLTINNADKTYVKISEKDGTKNYVHPTEIVELRQDIKDIKAIVEKWQ